MSFDLVAFAFEGVLVDSERIVAQARARALATAGLAVSEDELLDGFADLSETALLMKLEQNRATPVPARLIEEMERAAQAALAAELKPVSGVREALGELGGRYCAVSDAPLTAVRGMAETAGIADLLEGRIFSSAELKLPRRPAPDLFRFIVKTLGTKAERCMVVAGSPGGLRAAKAAGMRAIGFAGAGQATPALADRLTQAGAETVLSRLSGLKRVLSALSAWSPID